MAERTDLHQWLHVLPHRELQALRAHRAGTATPEQKAVINKMPPEFVAALEKEPDNGNQR